MMYDRDEVAIKVLNESLSLEWLIDNYVDSGDSKLWYKDIIWVGDSVYIFHNGRDYFFITPADFHRPTYLHKGRLTAPNAEIMAEFIRVVEL